MCSSDLFPSHDIESFSSSIRTLANATISFLCSGFGIPAAVVADLFLIGATLISIPAYMSSFWKIVNMLVISIIQYLFSSLLPTVST